MRIQNHSEKPVPRFFGDDKYHLGIELEVEAPDAGAVTNGLDMVGRPSYCYAKHDGSLNSYGWELVTHPISRNMWLKNPAQGVVKNLFSFVDSLRKIGYTSHGNGRCGLHVHVGLGAFGIAEPAPRNVRTQAVSIAGAVEIIERQGNNWAVRTWPRSHLTGRYHSSHLYWFMRVVNTRMFAKLSQRELSTLNRWAALLPVRISELGRRDGRYFGTNLTEQTVEVRVFRGNMKESRIRKAVESVIAAVEFSKTLRAADMKRFKQEECSREQLLRNEQPLCLEFAKWVDGEKLIYPNLYSFLVEVGYIKTGEVSACA